LEAERAFESVPGALERFAIRVEPIGTVRFTPGVLDETDLTESGAVYGEMRNEERAEIERLVAEYKNAGSPAERERVALEASRRFDGSPLAALEFRTKAGITATSDIPRGPVVREPEPTRTEPAIRGARVPGRDTETQRSSISSGFPDFEEWVISNPGKDLSDWEMARRQRLASESAIENRQRLIPSLEMSNEGSRVVADIESQNVGDREEAAEIEGTRSAAARSQQRALDNQQWVEWRTTAQEFQLLAYYGYTGEAAKTIYDSFKQLEIDGTLNEWLRSNAGGTLTPNQIKDTLSAWATGAAYQAYQVEGMPMSVPPRMATVDGQTRVTDRAGLVGRDGEFLRDESGNIIPGYDANAVQSFLYTQIDQKAYWDLADRLYNVGLLPDFTPGQIEAAVSNLFSEATKFGYTYDNLLYQKEKTLGVGNGMGQPRVGPSSANELNVYGESAQQAAEAVFGRRLTDDELRGVLADYDVMRREQPYYARSGATSPSGQVFSIESATDQWLRENRPEQYQNAKNYSAWGVIYDAALDGAFSSGGTQ
jgi:hypothetical protein